MILRTAWLWHPAIVDTTATGLPTDILKVAGMAVIMLKKPESYRRLFIRCLVPTPFTCYFSLVRRLKVRPVGDHWRRLSLSNLRTNDFGYSDVKQLSWESRLSQFTV